MRVAVYPAKGYSATLPIVDPAAAPTISITDDAKKIVFTRLGDRVRVAGTAELSGYDLELNPVRCEALTKRATEWFGAAIDPARAEYWTGLRPATPRTCRCSPYLTPSVPDVGHGTRVDMPAVRARRRRIVSVAPNIDFAFLELGRRRRADRSRDEV